MLQRAVPAYYQLGLWRVKYLQNVCCVCDTNLAVAQKEHLASKRSFFSLGSFYLSPTLYFSTVCKACHNSIEWQPQSLQYDIYTGQASTSFNLKIQSATPHLSYIRSAIIAFKYKEQVDALPVLVHALQQLARPHGCHAGNSVIVPTPTTSNRLKKRGYDPVSVLAYYLSKHWQIPVWQGVDRVDDVISQQGLDRHERQANISDAFHVNSSPEVKRLLLFDDVVTTGATLSAIASTLIQTYPNAKISAYCVSHGK